MKHEKTIEAINKMLDQEFAMLNKIELELHRLKNALEMDNKGRGAQRSREWVGLTPAQRQQLWAASGTVAGFNGISFEDIDRIEKMLKEKNT